VTAPRGPDPLARLAALAAPGQRDALLFARRAGGPFTVDAAAAALGCHRTVARQRLDRLEAAGLLAAEFRRPEGRSGPGAGRPAKVYRVPPEAEVDEFPSRRLPELVGLLVERVAADSGEERIELLRAIGRRYAGELAAGAGLGRVDRRLDRALPALCEALGHLGYQVRVREAGADRAVLEVPTCPLRPVVVASPEAAEIDRGAWIGLVEMVTGRSGATLECGTSGCLDRAAECAITLSLRRRRAGAPSV
jgi:predicted ArsR family transcriptional regulator